MEINLLDHVIIGFEKYSSMLDLGYLRKDMIGNGAGRLYTITYIATDASGNTAQASTTVTVPHNH